MSTGFTTQKAVACLGIVTAAAAAITMIKTIASLEDPRSKRASGGCCSSGPASDESSVAFPTVGSDPASNPYETQQSVYEYLLMHYGTVEELQNFPALQSQQMAASINFPRECAELCGKYLAQVPAEEGSQLRALDVGCSVGRSSFELARFANHVVGLDYSQAFVDAASEMQQAGELPYTMRTEGDLLQHAVARVSPALDRSRVQFIQGDACDLTASFPKGTAPFHVVLAANLLCRLPFPRRFLASLPSLVAPGGFVVMPSPYTWLESYTPRSEWIGGYVDAAGQPVKSFDGLTAAMTGDGYFRLVEAFDKPFFIRETARKNQWSVSHVTVWIRTDKLE